MSVTVAVEPDTEKTGRFLTSQLAKLNREEIPHHIAIIPDGNRRWAKKNMTGHDSGHSRGADILMEITKAAQELKVKVISFYAFSTENWSRPRAEVIGLMALFADYLSNQRAEMASSGIKLDTIGDPAKLPAFLNREIELTKSATAHCDGIRLVLAFNYGARDEMCRAFKKMLHDYDRDILCKEDINEQTISRYLDTCEWSDPELLIRTSGEVRISNFLLWQLSYSEIHISPVFWPEFTAQYLLSAILDYQERNRRWGGA